jgi:hypothetical protein
LYSYFIHHADCAVVREYRKSETHKGNRTGLIIDCEFVLNTVKPKTMSLHLFLTELLKRVVPAQGIYEPQIGNHTFNVMAVFQHTFPSFWFDIDSSNV